MYIFTKHRHMVLMANTDVLQVVEVGVPVSPWLTPSQFTLHAWGVTALDLTQMHLFRVGSLCHIFIAVVISRDNLTA